jgi:hypothetical protein
MTPRLPRLLIFLNVVQLCHPLAPSFSKFSDKVIGHWQGASYSFYAADPIGKSDDDDIGGFLRRGRWADHAVPLAGLCSPSSFLVTPTVGCTGSVEEVMRSCGGAVQGVREELRWSDKIEEEDEAASSLFLNRQCDGFTHFDDGSWALGEVSISSSTSPPPPPPPPPFVLDASISHADGSRRVLRLWFDDLARTGTLSEAHVACLAKSEGGGAAAVAAKWENGQLEMNGTRSVCEKEGDGKVVVVKEERATSPSKGAPWIATRLKWVTKVATNPSHGDEKALPNTEQQQQQHRSELPGRCFVESALLEDEGRLEVLVGSRWERPKKEASEADDDDGNGLLSEEKALLRSYDLASGHLQMVQLTTTTTTTTTEPAASSAAQQ